MQIETLKQAAIEALEDTKAQHIRVLDVRGLSSVTDYMIVATGSSTRQVSGIASNVASKVKELGGDVLSIEGEAEGDWVLVDLGDVVVHVMLPLVREFYQLERLWAPPIEGVTARVAHG